MTTTRTHGGLLALGMLVALGASACGSAGAGADLVPRVGDDLREEENKLQDRLSRQGASAQGYAQMAALRLAQKRLAGARSFVKRALMLDSRHVGALVMGARIASAGGDFEGADGYYRKAVEANPVVVSAIESEWAATLVGLARLRAQKGAPKGIVDALTTLAGQLPDRASRLREERGELYLTAADLWLTQGDHAQAVKAIASARQVGASGRKLAFASARVEALAGRRDRAHELFERWARGPDAGKRWVEVGKFYARRNDTGDALWAYQKAAGGAPGDAETQRHLAELALKAYEPVVAMSAFQRAARAEAEAAKPEERGLVEARALAKAADVMQKAAYKANADELFKAAVKLAPYDWETVQAYGVFLKSWFRWQEVEQLAKAHIKASFGAPEAAVNAARLLADASAVQAAIELLTKVANEPKAPPSLWLELAHLRELHADTKARDSAIERYEKLAGESLETLLEAGHAWLRYRRDTNAQERAQLAVKRFPKSLEAALLLADVHRFKGLTQVEHGVLERFMARADEKPPAALRIGERYAKHGDFARAASFLKQALAATDRETLRKTHRALFGVHLKEGAFNGGLASSHMRAWLNLARPGVERTAALRTLLGRTRGRTALAELRIEVLRELSEAQPDDMDVLKDLGEVYLRKKRYTRAREVYLRYLARSTKRAAEAEALGEKFLGKGQREHALAFFSLLDPEQIRKRSLHKDLGELYDRRGEVGRATQHYRLFIRLETKQGQASALIALGRQMLKAHRNDLAIEALEGALRLKPSPSHRASAKLELGRAHLRRGDAEQARAVLESYLEDRGSNQLRKLDAVASVYEKEGAHREAARIYRERFQLDRARHDSATFRKLCELYRRMGDREGLKQVAAELVKRSPRPQAYVAAAVQLERAGLAAEAGALLAAALELRQGSNTTRSLVLLAAARNALHRRDVNSAVSLLTKRVELRGRGSAREWREAATLLAQSGHPAAAVLLLGRPMRDGFADAELYLERGRLLLDVGRADDAHDDLVTALMRSLDLTQTVERIATIYKRAGQGERLRDIYARMAALSPGRSEHFLSLGEHLLEAGRLDEARQAFQRYLTLNERGQLKVARAYRQTHHVELALAHYERAFDHPSDDSAYNALREVAALVVRHGMLDKLERHVRRFLLVARDENLAFSRVAQVWQDIGEARRAVRWLKRALEVKSDTAQRLRLGQMLDALGQHEAARQTFAAYVRQAAEMDGGRRSSSSLTHAERAVQAIVGYYLPADEYGVRLPLDPRRTEAALAQLRSARAALGARPWLVVTEARVLVLLGRISRALALIRAYPSEAARAPTSEIEQFLTGLEKRERLDEALLSLEVFRAGSSAEELTRRQLRLEARRGLTEKARRTAADLVAKGVAGAHLKVGAALFEEGMLGLAEHHLRQALFRGKSRAAIDPAQLLLKLYRQQGRLDAARRLEILALVDRDNQDSVANRAIEAELLYHEGAYAEARQAADEALTLEPGSVALLQRAVRCSVMLEDAKGLWERVDAFQQRLITLASARVVRRWSDVLNNDVIAIIERMEAPAMALDGVERLIQLEQSTTAHRLRAFELALRAGDEERAASHRDAYLDLSGDAPDALLEIAGLYSKHLYEASAREYLAKVKGAEDMSGAKPHLLALELAVKAGRQSEAAGHLEAALKVTSDEIGTRIDAAYLIERLLGPPRLTAEVLAPLLEGERAPPLGLTLAAKAAWRAGDAERAGKLAGRYLDRYPARAAGKFGRRELMTMVRAAVLAGDARAVERLVGATVRVSKVVGARYAANAVANALEAGLERIPESAAVELAGLAERLLLRASANSRVSEDYVGSAWKVIELARGNKDEALAAYEAALAQQPSEAGTANNFAYALALVGRDLGRALKLVRAAHARRRSIDPASAYLDTEAWILHLMGRSAEALPIQLRAVRLAERDDPEGSTEILYHLGMIQAKLGRLAESRNTFRDCARRSLSSRYGRQCHARLNDATAR